MMKHLACAVVLKRNAKLNTERLVDLVMQICTRQYCHATSTSPVTKTKV